ncbi:hypothetical protein EBR43_07380 [bacterium]|nr:hypothetical protein [bacterium]
MKVYSLYHQEVYVASFPKEKDAIEYANESYLDRWQCKIVEEYLNKYPPISPQQTFPCNPS